MQLQPTNQSIALAGFRVELPAPTFVALSQEVLDTKEFQHLREERQDQRCLYLHDGQARGIPRRVATLLKFGAKKALACAEHL